MRAKIRLTGGSWYDDSGIIWSGALDELISVGGHVILKDGEFNAAFTVNNISIEINGSIETYVIFVSPISGVDLDVVNFYTKSKKLPNEEKDKTKT